MRERRRFDAGEAVRVSVREGDPWERVLLSGPGRVLRQEGARVQVALDNGLTVRAPEPWVSADG